MRIRAEINALGNNFFFKSVKSKAIVFEIIRLDKLIDSSGKKERRHKLTNIKFKIKNITKV